jgi:hypothetical protein
MDAAGYETTQLEQREPPILVPSPRLRGEGQDEEPAANQPRTRTLLRILSRR